MRFDDFVEGRDFDAVDGDRTVGDVFAGLAFRFVNLGIDEPVDDIFIFVGNVDSRHLAEGLFQFAFRQVGDAAWYRASVMFWASFRASGLWTKVVTSSARRRWASRFSGSFSTDSARASISSLLRKVKYFKYLTTSASSWLSQTDRIQRAMSFPGRARQHRRRSCRTWCRPISA